MPLLRGGELLRDKIIMYNSLIGSVALAGLLENLNC